MKYKTFIKIRNTGCFGLIASAIGAFYVASGSDTPPPPKEKEVYEQLAPSSAQSVSTALSTEHEAIIAFQRNTVLADGLVDANNNGLKLYKKFPTYILDLRCDKEKGFDYFNRVKIDWDKDKKWDEKWFFRKDGSIKREVASNDDNNYNQVVELHNNQWISPKQKSKHTTDQVTNQGNQYHLTTVQQAIINFQRNITLDQGKPDLNNNGFKLYKTFTNYTLDLRCDKEKGFDYFNRVKIDWDKDKKWDEKWFFRKDGSIKREVASNDDNNYNQVLELNGDKWLSPNENSTEMASTSPTERPNNKYLGLKAVHQEIIAFQQNTSIAQGKHDPNNNGVKLYKKFDRYFMDLRCDKEKGFDYFNRVKLDWDKDKKWDEKWFFRKDGSIKRECSTNDDKKYDITYELKEGDWVKK